MSSIRLAVAAVVGLLVLAGCAERPSADVLTDAILAAASEDPTVAVTDQEARCIADRLLGSGLSDTTLEGLSENFDSPEVLSAEVDQVEPIVAEAATACIGADG